MSANYLNYDTDLSDYKCETPSESSITSKEGHDRLRNVNGILECGICPEKFKGRKQLMRHVSSHRLPNGQFKCPHCHREFPTRVRLLYHLRVSKSMGNLRAGLVNLVF